MVNAKHAGVTFTPVVIHPHRLIRLATRQTARIICGPAECRVGETRISARQPALSMARSPWGCLRCRRCVLWARSRAWPAACWAPVAQLPGSRARAGIRPGTAGGSGDGAARLDPHLGHRSGHAHKTHTLGLREAAILGSCGALTVPLGAELSSHVGAVHLRITFAAFLIATAGRGLARPQPRKTAAGLDSLDQSHAP